MSKPFFHALLLISAGKLLLSVYTAKAGKFSEALD